MVNQLSTGVATLDRQFDGGIRPGRLLALVAPPASQSESLLRELMGERPSLYVATIRRREAVEESFDSDWTGTDDVTVAAADAVGTMDTEFLNRLTGTRANGLGGSDETSVVDRTYEAIEDLDGENRNVIVDPANPLEHTANRDAYRETLNALKSTLLETDSIGVLHCLHSGEVPEMRELSVKVADIVWEMDIESKPNTKEFQLTIPKNRGGRPVLEPISLRIGDEVYVDDSRNI